jgi:hypothetical protein
MAAFLSPESRTICPSGEAGGRRWACGTLRGSPAIRALRCTRVTNASSPRSIGWRRPCQRLSPAPSWTKLRYRRRASAREGPNGLSRPSTQLPHSLREIPFDRARPQGGRVAHQAVGVTDPVVALHHRCQNTQEALPILVVLEDHLAPVATEGDVIQGASKRDARGSGHAKS